MLIAIRKNIPAEHTPLPKLTNFEFLSIKLKQSPPLIIGAAYIPPKCKITNTELDAIITQSDPGYFLIGGDLNGKHKNCNNLNRNANGSTLKKHSELHNYHSCPTYIVVQPTHTGSQIACPQTLI